MIASGSSTNLLSDFALLRDVLEDMRLTSLFFCFTA